MGDYYCSVNDPNPTVKPEVKIPPPSLLSQSLRSQQQPQSQQPQQPQQPQIQPNFLLQQIQPNFLPPQQVQQAQQQQQNNLQPPITFQSTTQQVSPQQIRRQPLNLPPPPSSGGNGISTQPQTPSNAGITSPQGPMGSSPQQAQTATAASPYSMATPHRLSRGPPVGHAPPPPGSQGASPMHSGFSSSCGMLPAMGSPIGRPAPRPPTEKAPPPPGSQGGAGVGSVGQNKKTLKPHPGLLRQSYHVFITIFSHFYNNLYHNFI